MSALGHKVMDLAEQQGLLDGRAIAELRKQVAESKFIVTPEAIAKVLVDHGYLTPFQARKLVGQALGDEPDPVEQRVVEKSKAREKPKPVEDLTFADPADRAAFAPPRDIEIVGPHEAKPEKKPPPSRPAAKNIPIGKSEKPKETKPTVEPPVEGSTADDFVELESIDAAPHTRGNRWKTDAPGSDLAETIELTPLDLSAPPNPPVVDLEPIDDLFGPDPIPAPAPTSTPTSRRPVPAPQSFPAPATYAPTSSLPKPLTPLDPLAPLPRRKKNVWDSPLLLIGGGALGVILILFAILFYALTRGTAAEVFNQAEEEYRGGSYSNAIAIYDKFLKQYPSDANASLARVRRGMAALRQVTDDGKNPRLGLETANQVLPSIEKEENFADARGELATILPDIADGFATEASQTSDPTRKADLLKSAGEALTLVNNPAYLPASLRKDREGHISRIVDKLKAAERGIQQEKDLTAAVESIAAATEKGNAAGAYELQAGLLRTYPALATNPRLVAAIRQVGEKERQLVKVTSGGPAPITTDYSPGSDRVVIALADQAAAATGARPVFLLIEGAVYGIDAGSGKVLWRRFVGHETTNQPVSLPVDGGVDTVLIDSRRHEIARLKGTTGQLVWRHDLGGPAFGPVVSSGQILLSTRKGSMIAIEAATGQIVRSAQLPQGVTVAPAARQSRVFQLGEHSTLFVLDANSLACTETFYLGHQAGEILVPPLAVLDQALIIQSPADDYSEIHILSPDPKTKRLAALDRPKRLKGRVVTPPAVTGARIAVITDIGQVAVYDVDSANESEHLRFIAGLDATESSPRRAYCEFTKSNRLWVASHRRSLFDVQSALSLLSRVWTENHDDSFLAPLRVQGETLVQVRRRPGISAVLVEGSRTEDAGLTKWTTHLAAPVGALVPSPSRQTVEALTTDGRLYSLGNEQFIANLVQRPSVPAGSSSRAVHADASLSTDGQTLVWTESSAVGSVYFYDLKTGGKPTSISLPIQAAAPAAAFGGGAVAPLTNGSVMFISPNSAEPKVPPFLPPLVPDALPLWTQPVVFADNATFLISDGRGSVYAVTKHDRPQPQLAQAGEAKTNGPIHSPLVLAGSTAVGVVRHERSDAVAGFDSKAAVAFEPVPLEGRVTAGPFAVGGLFFVAAEPDGLVCLSGDGKIRWKQATSVHGPIAGPPLATTDGDLLVAFQSGIVCRLDAATGKELSKHDIGEPLFGPLCIQGANVYLAGSDGVVHRTTVPPRP